MGEGSDDGRVIEWEIGLPSAEDLTPLSQSLIPPELASAFSIAPEPFHSLLEVHRASHNTFSALRSLKSFPPFPSDDPMVVDVRRSEEEADSSVVRSENSDDDQSNRALKRPRLVWTSLLHKRFVDVVSHLGIKDAVPKTIMQQMNVEGLTRENVASHLQKYRLYLQRMQGLSNEGPSPSDLLFGSTPVPQSIQEQPVPAAPPMIPMPVFGMAHHNYGHNGPMSMLPVDNYQGNWGYHGNKLHHLYGGLGERSRDWSGGDNFGSIATYPRVFPNDK